MPLAVLDARERRAEKVAALARKTGNAVITVRANYPGQEKNNVYANFVASSLAEEVKNVLTISKREWQLTADGLIFYFCSGENPFEIKRRMIHLEETHPLGRLVDLDVITVSGALGRQAVGIAERRCFLCNERAVLCVRNRTHSLAQITAYFSARVFSFLKQGRKRERFARALHFGCVAELSRVRGYGCVTFADTGNHQDMDALLLLDSIEAIKKALVSMDWDKKTDFTTLRKKGRQIEALMRNTTGGINTHKGLLFFSILLLDAYLFGGDISEWQAHIQKRAAPLHKDFAGSADTHGLRIYQKHGVLGARGLALSGFKPLFDRIRPDFSRHGNLDRLTLAWMTETDDTTAIHRAGVKPWRELKKMAKEAAASAVSPTEVETFAQETGLTTGGIADLVTITLVTAILEEEYKIGNQENRGLRKLKLQ